MRSLHVCATLMLGACIRPLESPHLGRCAAPPPEVHTYGEIGIGTCLAGPADLRFVELDGRTYLGVANADPYMNFAGGSLLLIDWASVDLARDTNLMHDLDASAVDLPRYVGGVGFLPERGEALVTSRLSEDAITRDHDDVALVVDLSDPTRPRRSRGQPSILLRDDPQPVQVDAEAGLIYVGNITDHSVSLIDTTGPRLERVDVAPSTRVDLALPLDADDSGSVAELDGVTIEDPRLLLDDVWTLTYVDGLFRMWVPTPIPLPTDATPDAPQAVGLTRWTSGGTSWAPSAFGIEVDLDSVGLGDSRDPSLAMFGELPVLYLSDGAVIRSLQSLGFASSWEVRSEATLVGNPTGWDALLGAPSVVVDETRATLFYDGRVTAGAPGAIGVAWSDDLFEFTSDTEPLLDPAIEGYDSLEDPFVRNDAMANRLRMWLSLRSAGRWTIGLSESDDGLAWSPVQEVFSLPSHDVAAPTVQYVNGRYLLWYARGDGTRWDHALAWSYDGIAWNDMGVVVGSELPYDGDDAPRVALQVDPTGAWRIEGRDAGLIDALLFGGSRFVSGTHGFGVVVAGGHETRNDLFPANGSSRGLRPGSMAMVRGRPVLYVTATGLDGRTRLGAIEQVGDAWAFLEGDIIEAGSGGNIAGVSDPVVWAHEGVYTLFYAATDAEGATTIRRATSVDGRRFEAERGAVVRSGSDFDGRGQLPHAIEPLEDGRVRLWYAGTNGSRFRIGSAVANSPRGRFQPEPTDFEPYKLGTGVPGSFDDSGVRDPLVVRLGDQRTMLYSGFDGLAWHLGVAVFEGGRWVRRQDPESELSIPAMSALRGTFSALGVDSPVLDLSDPEGRRIFHAGFDGVESRLGRAVWWGDVAYPQQRFPTSGDILGFSITKGVFGDAVIELAQTVEHFSTNGIGMSSLVHDPVRGFLYATSKLANFVYVVDVRDDLSSTFVDANVFDLEGLIRVETEVTPLGFRSALVDQRRDRLYLSARDPDGVVVVDLDNLEDNDTKEVLHDAAIGVLPLPDLGRDIGEDTLAVLGGSGMAQTLDGRFLLAAHFRGNAVVAYDLEMGTYGEEVAHIQYVGENPHLVRLSPDGRTAVVANYVGDIDENLTVSSTLAVIDADPASETFLQVLTWLRNL